MPSEENQDPAIRAAVQDFRDAHQQYDDDVKSVTDETDKMVEAFDTLLEEVEHLQNAVKEAEEERAEAEKVAYTTVPEMLRDVERGSHTLEEVIDRINRAEWTVGR